MSTPKEHAYASPSGFIDSVTDDPICAEGLPLPLTLSSLRRAASPPPSMTAAPLAAFTDSSSPLTSHSFGTTQHDSASSVGSRQLVPDLRLDVTDQTDPRVTEGRRLFEQLDADGDGLINLDELQQAVCRLGVDVSEDDASELMAVLDANGDGLVTIDEFMQGLGVWLTAQGESVLQQSASDDLLSNDASGEALGLTPMELYNLRALFSILDIDSTNFVPICAFRTLPSISGGQISCQVAEALIKWFEERGTTFASQQTFAQGLHAVQPCAHLRASNGTPPHGASTSSPPFGVSPLSRTSSPRLRFSSSAFSSSSTDHRPVNARLVERLLQKEREVEALQQVIAKYRTGVEADDEGVSDTQSETGRSVARHRRLFRKSRQRRSDPALASSILPPRCFSSSPSSSSPAPREHSGELACELARAHEEIARLCESVQSMQKEKEELKRKVEELAKITRIPATMPAFMDDDDVMNREL